MATDLSSLLKGGIILPCFEASSRKQALHALSEELGRVTGISAREIEDSVMERERLGSTGVGEGVAIPHARVDGIDAPIGGFMRLATGVDFEAIDDRPCDLIFMLLAPLPAVRDALREANTVDDVKAIICKEAVETSI